MKPVIFGAAEAAAVVSGEQRNKAVNDHRTVRRSRPGVVAIRTSFAFSILLLVVVVVVFDLFFFNGELEPPLEHRQCLEG